MFGDATCIECGVAFLGEGIGVEGDERVFAAYEFERGIEGEQAREVSGVGDESRPDFGAGDDSGGGPGNFFVNVVGGHC